MINIVVPMAGKGSRFKEAGFEKPKPFIDINGKTMIERVLDNLEYKNAKYILIGRKDDLCKEYKLVELLTCKNNINFIELDNITEGTACTVMSARKYINNDEPLIIANSDQIVDIDISEFIHDAIARNLDGSIMTFINNTRDEKWSYAKINSENIVVEVREKKAISEFATVGIYYYKHGRMFIDAAIDMIVNNERVNNEFYACPTYNYAIKDGLKIGIYNIDQYKMHGVGTPQDLAEYIKLNRN